MTECNRCGRCCDPVVLPFTQNDVRKALPGTMHPDDRRFILEDLTPIPRKEGLAAADYLTQGGKSAFGFAGDQVVIFSSFYRCRHYDEETRECRAYEQRPPLCADYPWYDEGADPAKALPPECSYNADVGRPVKLIPKPEKETTRG